MKLPILILNFKNYEEASNTKALKLAKICDEAARKFRISIVVCPQFTDLKEISKKFKKIFVFSQHIDPIESAGAFTGHIIAENIKDFVNGTLINHSERKLKLREIRKCVKIAKKYHLISVCCAKNLKEVKEIAKFSPDFIAIEPPELIGKGRAISKVKPDIITRTIEEVKKINKRVKVLCGAGIVSGEDVKKAIELGSKGVLVSSAFVKAKKPKRVLFELIKGLL